MEQLEQYEKNPHRICCFLCSGLPVPEWFRLERNISVPVPLFQSGHEWNRSRAVFPVRDVDPLRPVNGKTHLLFVAVSSELDQDALDPVAFRYGEIGAVLPEAFAPDLHIGNAGAGPGARELPSAEFRLAV